MTDPADSPFSVQDQVRAPWRRYLDSLAPLRPSLYRYCSRLTGNVWDGEDLAQDTLVRVFSLLGKIDANLENPRGYLIRTATNLWIDRTRRRTLEREFAAGERASATESGARSAPRTSRSSWWAAPRRRASSATRRYSSTRTWSCRRSASARTRTGRRSCTTASRWRSAIARSAASRASTRCTGSRSRRPDRAHPLLLLLPRHAARAR